MALVDGQWTQPPVCSVEIASLLNNNRQSATSPAPTSRPTSATTARSTAPEVKPTRSSHPASVQHDKEHEEDCGATPPKVENAAVKSTYHGRPARAGDRATYRCTKGYCLVGNDTIMCKPNGKWSPKPSCVVRDCSKNLKNGRMLKQTGSKNKNYFI